MKKYLFKLIILFICLSAVIFNLFACNSEYDKYNGVEDDNNVYSYDEIKTAFEYASEQPASMSTILLKDMGKIREILGNGTTHRISETNVCSKYNCTNGGKLFVIYDDKTADYDIISNVFFSMKKLKYSNFNNIQAGISTLDDIKEIDPASDITYINYSNEKYTTHLTENGIVKINYDIVDGKEIVESISIKNNDLINKLLRDGLIY